MSVAIKVHAWRKMTLKLSRRAEWTTHRFQRIDTLSGGVPPEEHDDVRTDVTARDESMEAECLTGAVLTFGLLTFWFTHCSVVNSHTCLSASALRT